MTLRYLIGVARRANPARYLRGAGARRASIRTPPSQRPDQPRTPQDLREKSSDSHIAFEGAGQPKAASRPQGLPRNAVDAEAMTAVTANLRGGEAYWELSGPTPINRTVTCESLQKNDHARRIRDGERRWKLASTTTLNVFRETPTRGRSRTPASRLVTTTTRRRRRSCPRRGTKGLHRRRRPEIRQGGLQGQGTRFGGCRKVEFRTVRCRQRDITRPPRRS